MSMGVPNTVAVLVFAGLQLQALGGGDLDRAANRLTLEV
ncbi:hypothetical protein BH24CHL2_BH24CHL2_8210 [soil metagenome]|jgi:hypothetical protein